jgi:xanthine/uracil permease
LFDLPTIDLVNFVNNLIKIALGFVGTIIFLNFLNAGYLLMFSGGDHEKKEQAKQLFSSSIIGLIIMLLSYSLVRFLIQTMLSSSNFGTNL